MSDKNSKKRFRQGNLFDFIQIKKVPRRMSVSSPGCQAEEATGMDSAQNGEPTTSSSNDERAQENGHASEQNIDTETQSVCNSDTENQEHNDAPSKLETENQVLNDVPSKSDTENHMQDDIPSKSDNVETLNDTISSEELFNSESDSLDSSVSTEKCSSDGLIRYTQFVQNLPPLRPSEDHAVLFNYNTIPGSVPLPFPKTYRDKWDNFHVRLPCSPQSLYPVKNALTGEVELQSRWGIIQSALSNPIHSTIDLEEAILTYNSQYSKQWNFNGLHRLFTEGFEPSETKHFFENLLPKIIELCLRIPDICTQPIPLLQLGRTYQITLSQKQIASLLANAFLCTFPRRNTQNRSSEYNSYPPINFNTLYDPVGRPNKVEKLKCLINYFRCVTKDEPTGLVTFHRQCVQEFPNWRESKEALTNLCVQSEGLIEVDGMGMLQIDFANRFVGGGVLKSGCVQEEIRFVLCPELIVSRLFTERLDKTEALIVTGCEQFNQHTGYAETFCWDGNFEDCIPRDSWGRKLTKVVAIDALRFTRSMEQFEPELIQRELEKAFAGFYEPAVERNILPAVATGNWGCGAFRGDPRLKVLIQLISASAAGRDLLYLTFNDSQLEKDIRKIYRFLKSKNITVGQLVKILEDFHEQVVKPYGKVSKAQGKDSKTTGKDARAKGKDSKTKGMDSLYSYLFRRCFDSDTEAESQC